MFMEALFFQDNISNHAVNVMVRIRALLNLQVSGSNCTLNEKPMMAGHTIETKII